MNNEIFELNDKRYSLDYQPAVISFEEYPKLKAQVDSLRDQFSNWEVTPENMKSSKETRAKLRKFSKAINQKKIKIVKVIDSPVANFKGQIKGLCLEVDQTATVIDKQIKAYEDKAKQDRHDRNVKYIKKTVEENKLSADATNYIMDNYDQRWDNKSYRFPMFQKDVADLITQFLNLTRFKHEAHETIISRASELRLMPDKYIESLDRGEDLNQVLSSMKDEREYLNNLSKKQAETKKREQAQLKKQGDKAYDPDTGEVKDKLYTAKLVFDEITPDDLVKLASFLKDWSFKENLVAASLTGTKEQFNQLNSFLQKNEIETKRVK